MKTYTQASEDVSERVSQLVKRHYPELVENKVKIDLLFVSHDGDGPALVHGGYAAVAVVRSLGPKERAMGRGDAEIVIDEERYHDKNFAERDALIDHELYHLEVRKSRKTGLVKIDGQGRPLLKLRKHDRQFGWFDAIAERHGEASGEVRQALQLKATAGQFYFPFIEQVKVSVKPAKASRKKTPQASRKAA